MNRELIDRTDQADREARTKGLKGEEHSQYVANKLHDHVDEIITKLKENNPDKFGASAPGTAIKNMYNKIKGDTENK